MDMKKIIESEKKFIMPTYSRHGIAIESGKGCCLFDSDGKKYIDLAGGLATCSIGHGNLEFADALRAQIGKVTNPTNLYYTEEQVKLAEKISGLSGLDKCFFSNSGAESIEAAIKLARKRAKKKNAETTGKIGIIAARNSFHGRTFGSLAATGKEKIRDPFRPMLGGFSHVEYDNAEAVENAITDETAAVIVEPIQGEAGIIVPEEDYLKSLREICDRHGLLLILDEIQTGCGRTGRFFAYEHSKIKPDIVTLAKGLANGIPIGVTVARDEIALSFEKGDHGSTFGGNPVVCRAANFTVEFIMKNKLMGNATANGDYFINKLKSIKSNTIKEVRGKGLMIGIELNVKGAEIVKKCLEKKLLINCTNENVLRLLPPLIIDKQTIDTAFEVLKEVLEDEN
ncbi:aspartate aminotransferase family protein [Candidatus Woesearchaeota archaeon]|nr:aspartate aminotransferase family protein [Candidatus Woesearchaeota archaeon]